MIIVRSKPIAFDGVGGALGHTRVFLEMGEASFVECGYCDRRYDCANESRPGVTSEVISPEAALDRVERALRLVGRLRVAGVAGPGEPPTNPATLETLRLIHARFPRLLLCLSTNGLVLSDALPELLDCGVSTLTVTVNTRSVVCAGHVYRAVGGSAVCSRRRATRRTICGSNSRASAMKPGIRTSGSCGLTDRSPHHASASQFRQLEHEATRHRRPN